jgi:DNA-binding transcriptional regulator YhcF (GntR family)
MNPGIDLAINTSSGIPMTDQLVSGITNLIRTRQLLSGAKLPSIRALAESQQISRFPVIEAYDRLSSLGMIVPTTRAAVRIRAWLKRNRTRSSSNSTIPARR